MQVLKSAAMGLCLARGAARRMLIVYIRVLRAQHKLWTRHRLLYQTTRLPLEHRRTFRRRCSSPRHFLDNWSSHCHMLARPSHIQNNTLPIRRKHGATIHIQGYHLSLLFCSRVHFQHMLKICCLPHLPCRLLKDHILAQKPPSKYFTALRFRGIAMQVWITCPEGLDSCPT